MKTSTLERNGVSTEMVELIGRLVDLIAWPARRRAMGDVAMTLLDGKRRVAARVRQLFVLSHPHSHKFDTSCT